MTLLSKLSDKAKCIGTTRFLWDQIELNDFSAVALKICGECPVRRECYEWVLPEKSYYDGVAAGHIYKNGKLIV